MKIVMYGLDACDTCREAKRVLSEKGADFAYLKISDTVANMRRFLKMRDNEEIFRPIKEEGRIGVPCFLLDDGTLTLSLDEVLAKLEAQE